MGVRKGETNQTDKAGGPATGGKPSSGARRTRKPRKTTGHGVGAEHRHRLIAEAAYLLAEQRGFGADGCLNDWLQAERAVDDRLLKGGGPAESAS